MANTRKRILFICTHNSARSQMAEGLARSMYHQYDFCSAGTEVTSVNPLAIQAMAEIGIDISNYSSKTVEKFIDTKFDLVVSVCDSAKENCPYFPNAKRKIHVSFPDPSSVDGPDEKKIDMFRKVRDLIHVWLHENLEGILATLP